MYIKAGSLSAKLPLISVAANIQGFRPFKHLLRAQQITLL
jgi:hypothetical protein